MIYIGILVSVRECINIFKILSRSLKCLDVVEIRFGNQFASEVFSEIKRKL